MSGKYSIKIYSNKPLKYPLGNYRFSGGWELPEAPIDINMDIKKYIMKINTPCMIYGNTAVALHFYNIHKPAELIYIENLKGLTPFILASYCKIHLFSNKKIYFQHPNIMIYNRLPGDEDFKNLEGLPLINTMCYAPTIPSSYGVNTFAFSAVAESNKYIERFKPKYSVSLYNIPSIDTYFKIMHGKMWICPFYLVSNNNYVYVYQSEFLPTHKIIRTADINDRVFFYKYYIKFKSWEGVDYDTFLCRPYWDKKVKKLMGPLPTNNNPHFILYNPAADIGQYTGNKIIENTYVGELFPIYFKPYYTGSFARDILLYVFPEYAKNGLYLYVHDDLTDYLKRFCPFVVEKDFDYSKNNCPTIFVRSYAEAKKKYKMIPYDLLDPFLVNACADLAKKILKNPDIIKINSPLAKAAFKKAFPEAFISESSGIDYSDGI